jgi:N-methylhydantoinase A
MPYGGAGPTQANLLAEEARISTILIPPVAGTFCALGAIIANVQRDFVRSVRRELVNEKDSAKVWNAFSLLEEEATAWVKGEGEILRESYFIRSLDMSYKDQAYSFNVEIPEEIRSKQDYVGMMELFHKKHERLYGFQDPETTVKVETVRLRAIGNVPPIGLPNLQKAAETPMPSGTRKVFHSGRWFRASTYNRIILRSGHNVYGPCLVEQADSTVLVLPEWRAQVDKVGNLHLTKGK